MHKRQLPTATQATHLQWLQGFGHTEPHFFCHLQEHDPPSPESQSTTTNPQDPDLQCNVIEALETTPEEPIDLDAPINDPEFPEDEEALWANQLQSSNKP
ncbi:hypothetical protein C0992_010745 [Termitomyces sp. T32_za158]|nr:hypothetical protein C0992_010745 [Termitomyces sp. T32_za158]